MSKYEQAIAYLLDKATKDRNTQESRTLADLLKLLEERRTKAKN